MIIQDQMFSLARRYGETSQVLYSQAKRLPSGADTTDAERYRIQAACCRGIGILYGEAPIPGVRAPNDVVESQVDEVIAKARAEWQEFCEMRQREIAEAPKIQTGPSAGQSSIAYKFAGPDAIETPLARIKGIWKKLHNAQI